MAAPTKKLAAKKKKTGRPLAVVDEEQVYKLSQFGCTYEEIGSFFDVNGDTIRRRFAGTVAKGRDHLKRVIRKKQVELAMRGDRTMLIWLGKQLLGQSEPALIQQTNNVVQVTEDPKKRLERWKSNL
jgi:hypothetical protein